MPLLIVLFWMLIFTCVHHHHPTAVVVAGRGMAALPAGDHHQQLRHVRALPNYYSDASASGEGNYEANKINTAAEADDSTGAGQVNNGGQGFTSAILYTVGGFFAVVYLLAYWILNLHKFKITTTTQVPPPPPDLVPSPPPPAPPAIDLLPVLPAINN